MSSSRGSLVGGPYERLEEAKLLYCLVLSVQFADGPRSALDYLKC
jgi:hypothetical protein